MTKRIQLLGCPIDVLSMDQTLQQCLSWCREKPSAKTLMTVNAAHLIMMHSDEALRHACVSGDVIVADGMPVVWASRLVGDPLSERVAGVDIMDNLLKLGHEHKLRIFLLGAKQEIIDKLHEIAQHDYPNLIIAGSRNGYFSKQDYPEVIQQIRDSQSDILFIGMPSPFKEVWGEEHRDEFGVSVIIGVGGSFDVIAGYVKRAPLWMQKIGMEWFWRFLMEPRKMWKRYLVNNSLFIFRVGREFFQRRILRREASSYS
jgi:N-acetylglucosaminyldiphosphoundecaprenol N-acetyl-beta-D-mannosaminyltransferase